MCFSPAGSPFEIIVEEPAEPQPERSFRSASKQGLDCTFIFFLRKLFTLYISFNIYLTETESDLLPVFATRKEPGQTAR